MQTPLKLLGGFGSPYSRKMRAVLRFRRIPFRWIMRGSASDVGIPPVPVALIPVLVFPGEDGAPDQAMNRFNLPDSPPGNDIHRAIDHTLGPRSRVSSRDGRGLCG